MLIATVKSVLTLQIKVQPGQRNSSIEDEANNIVAKMIATSLSQHNDMKRSYFVDYNSSVSNIVDRSNLVIQAILSTSSMEQGPRIPSFIGNEDECEEVKQAYDLRMGELDYQLTSKVYTSYCIIRQVNELQQEVNFLGIGYGDIDYSSIQLYESQSENN